MVRPAYAVQALDQSTWAAFAALVERNNGIFGGCWCMGFHPEDSRTDAAQNRAAKQQRVREGHAHAALVFDDDDCVGWCQFGAPGEVPGSRTGRRMRKAGRPCQTGESRAATSVRDIGVRAWPPRRSPVRSISSRAWAGGPSRDTRRAPARCPPACFHGALSTYEKLGFVRDRKIGKHRWVVTRTVEPAPNAMQVSTGHVSHVTGEA